MTEPSSAASSPAARQFFVLPAFSAAGGALMTACYYPADPDYPRDARVCLLVATVVGLLSGLAIAVVFRSSDALRRNDVFGHYRVVVFALLGSHLLWAQPIWAFHHDYFLGVFAWLGMGGEEGFTISPNLCGLPLTLATFTAYCGFLHGPQTPSGM